MQSMETVANGFKLKTAGFMASYFCSRTILNALFISLFTFVIIPLITNGSEPESCLLAIIPSLLATMILWFRFKHKYANWIMEASTRSPYGLEHFRTLGFLLFLCGAYYHCIDFLGAEKTTLWGMGITFSGLMLATIGFWLRFAIQRRIWKYLF